MKRVYRVERGQPPFDPAMMTGLLLYGYCNGVYSSRRDRQCGVDASKGLAGGKPRSYEIALNR